MVDQHELKWKSMCVFLSYKWAWSFLYKNQEWLFDLFNTLVQDQINNLCKKNLKVILCGDVGSYESKGRIGSTMLHLIFLSKNIKYKSYTNG